MGKWVEVRCNCPNRIARRLGPSSPHELTYDCGHPDGTICHLWPGYLFDLARFLKCLLADNPDLWREFNAFGQLERWIIAVCQLAAEEYFAIGADEAVRFQKECEDLLKLDEGISKFPNEIHRKWRDHWDMYFEDPWDRQNAGSVTEIIRDGMKLCQASIETGNPIEFGW